jgi:cytochrome c
MLGEVRGLRATAILILAAAACGSSSPSAAAAGAGPAFRVLVFTKTAGYRHDSIPAAIAAVEQLGAANGFAVNATEDASVFNDSSLAQYRVVMFLLTSDDVLDSNEQAALMRYIEGGGAFVGVHSASDTEQDWPWYGGLVGAYFKIHPAIQQATIDVVDRDTPSTIHLPTRWVRTDEWYNFDRDPSSSVTVLEELDETTYSPGPGAMGASHPLTWQHVYDGGRSWYTGAGHTTGSYSEPLFLQSLLGGIIWAAGYDLPSFQSLSVIADGGRLDVTASHPDCYRCELQVRVWTGRRAQTTTVDASGTQTTAETAPLPPGRHLYAVVLTNETMKAHATRRGRIAVS